ncbi:MAG: IMP cyclohydrolase [Clostridiales bacterium]|nr:IMP cyclohydrolase [Clostridiales bacterium]
MKQIRDVLSGNAYPGRGILLGRTADGSRAAAAYFIMGRSVNSRNRVFVEDGDGIRTRAFDESRLTDPSLIIYAPVRVLNGGTIVTNGDQTDTVYDALAAGGTFEAALRTRTFEPDAPNYTPRISGLLLPDGHYNLSILKCADGDPDAARRYFFEYEALAGRGHLIHTYRCDGDPIPSFEGEPVEVMVPDDFSAFTDSIWNSLDRDNKVSLFTRFIDLKTGETQTKIINKHGSLPGNGGR